MTSFTWAPKKFPGKLTATEVANAVWDAQTSAHTASGSFGALVKKLLTVAKFLALK